MDYVDENEDPVERALHLSREKKPAGLLFLGGDRRMYAKSYGEITLPSVVLTTDAARLGFDNLSSVTTDDVEAAECAHPCGAQRAGYRCRSLIVRWSG